MGGKGPPRPSSSESDDWGDESWIVDCPCGVNYDDGEEMVDCDECGVWVHTACCKVTKVLPTYVCDKCKIKKKLKESELTEVAEALADLPSKPVSFDERNHEKPGPLSAGRQNAPDTPIAERVHVQGIPGGHPSFFERAPRIFCRQLWKNSGYAPKVLNLKYEELPEARDDVLEFLHDAKDCEVFANPDDSPKFLSVGLENGHAMIAAVGTSNSREEEVSKDLLQVCEESLKDREGKSLSLQARKGEVKHSKHKHRPKVKEEKPHQQSKRPRDEGTVKEQGSKKKPRTNGDVSKPEDWDSTKRVDVASQETSLLSSKSPLSSPKNPKAMKKLAELEFLEGDVMPCTVCGKVETALVDVRTGRSSGDGGSDWLCQECEKVRRRASPLSPKQETASAKQEPVVLPVPPILDNGVPVEVKYVSKRELEYGEEPVRATVEGNRASPDADRQDKLGKIKVGSDSLSDSKKTDVDVSVAHKTPGMHDSLKVKDEKRRPSPKSFLKGDANALIVNHTSADIKTGDVPEALDLPAVRTVVAAKARGESASRAEELRQDGAQVVASRHSHAYDAETRTAGETSTAALCGSNRQAVSLDGHLPVSSSNNSTKPVPSSSPECSVAPVLPSSTGLVPPERADGNSSSGKIVQDRVVPAADAESPEDRANKLPIPTINVEPKSQGSARTAGHLPASVRGKMLGERGNSYLQRSVSGAAAQQQASPRPGQSLVQFSVCGTPRSAHTSSAHTSSAHMSGAMAASSTVKGSSGEDPASGKQHGQAPQECISPVSQVSKQGQPSRLHATSTVAQKSPPGVPELSSPSPSPSQPSSSAPRTESDQQPPSKALPGAVEPSRIEASTPKASTPKTFSPKESNIATETQVPKPSTSTQATPPTVFCQQARQLNGIGHVYVSRKSMNSCIAKDLSGSQTAQALASTVSITKLSASSLKSPSSGTSSSSPTSPLVTTPSSKPLSIVKVPESLPSQKSLTGGSNAHASVPHSSSKLSNTTSSTVSNSKQAGALQVTKSIPSPASPQSAKLAGLSKQSSRSSSLPVTKSVDGKSTSGVGPSRGAHHSGSSSKENTKTTITHTSIKTASKVNALPAGTKPPSSGKSSHSLASTKGSSVSKHHSGHAPGTAKTSSTPSSTKHTGSHQSKSGISHKDEKPTMPTAPPVPKAMSTMPPPPPQVSAKRSSSGGLASSAATTLKDEELALLLHQELNSSPRVPRVPRVRQAGVNLQLVTSPSLSSAKGSFVSAASGGHSHKDRHLAPRKRIREDRHKDSLKASVEVVGKSGRKRLEEKRSEDEKHSSEKGGHNGTVDGFKEKFAEGNSRHHGFAKGNLSIIVPGNDDAHDGDKKSPAHANILTLPGLIDEVLGSGAHHLSYEDVCEAVLPHWPKLRKPNGERYAYPSHRQAVLDCLRNRPAWAHLVARGPKTHPGRKRPRNDLKSLSDSDDEDNEHLRPRDADEVEIGKSFKRRKASDGEKLAGDASERQKSSDAITVEDGRRGGRQERRRRRVEIEDGTDGEDDPVPIIKKAAGEQPEVSKSDDGTSQDEEEEDEDEDEGEDEDEDEEPEAESSPSSEDEASNYSTDDEEMVVHRGIRNRRRPTDESSSDEDDVD